MKCTIYSFDRSSTIFTKALKLLPLAETKTFLQAFNSGAISDGYRQDTKCKDRLHLLCSVVIQIKGDFHKDSVIAVEPLGPTDSRIIQERGYEQRLQTRFKNKREHRNYCEENRGRITFERGGQHFPR